MRWLKLDEVCAEDVVQLVHDDRQENTFLDYKLKRPDKWKSHIGEEDAVPWEERLEFLKDVTSMANGRGGDILYGVAESDGQAGKIFGIDCERPDQLITELKELCRSRVEPSLRIRARTVENDWDKGPVLIVRVPDSWKKPHCVYFEAQRHSRYFFMREGRSKHPMSNREIKQQYLGWQNLQDRLESFRTERLDRLEKEKGAYPLDVDTMAVFHLVPIREFAGDAELAISETQSEPKFWLRPLKGSGGDDIFNEHGRVMLNFYGPNDVDAYAQIFRNGSIESVGNRFADDSFRPGTIQRQISGRIDEGYLKGIQHLEIEGPFWATISLLGWAGVESEADHLGQFDIHLQRNRIELPGVVVDEVDGDADSEFAELWDYLWQAFGVPRSPYG